VTVAELILALQAMPDKDAEVYFGDDELDLATQVTRSTLQEGPHEREIVIID
jgi:hypothetical protein